MASLGRNGLGFSWKASLTVSEMKSNCIFVYKDSTSIVKRSQLGWMGVNRILFMNSYVS